MVSTASKRPTEEWRNATDLATEDELRAEIARLRQLALSCVNAKLNKKRVKDNINLSGYEKKYVPKSENVKNLLRAAMADNCLFRRCRETEKEELLDTFMEVKFSAGTTIMRQGDKGETFYVVESGTCEVLLDAHKAPVATPTKGNTFGELALMYNTPRAATVAAKTDVTCWKIDRREFRLILAHNARLRSESYKTLLKEVKLRGKTNERLLADCLTEEQLTKLADCMDEEDVPAGHNIIVEGEEGNTFYVIAEGDVEISTAKDGVVGTFTKGAYFGDRALVADEKRAATCKAIKNGVKVLAVDREDFIALLGSIDELVESGSNVTEHVELTKRAAAEITLADLTVIRTLGHGAFGRVKLVKHGTFPYALKSQAKSAIVENHLQDHVLMERDILMQLDHPFILKLICAFQDDRYIYFLLELLIGGELFTHLRKLQRFPEPTMKVYAGAVTLAFDHMHAKNIAYRDLKPENLVLDKDGYLKVVDLGLAKVVNSKTWTLCGTPDYLAPEIILNEGHDKAVDYWALGVLMYELVAGRPPFYADDPMEVYEKILSGNMSFPSHFGRHLADIVRKFLKICQSKRLGNGKGGVGAVKKHRFFAGFAWNNLLARTMPPPIPIDIKDCADASNFDTYEEETDNRSVRVLEAGEKCRASQVRAVVNETGEAECQTCHGTFVEMTNPWADDDAGLREFLGNAAPSSNEARPTGPRFSNRTPGAELVASAIQQILSQGSQDQPSVGTLFGGTGGAGDFLGSLQPLLALPARNGDGTSLLGDYAVGNITNIIEQLMANDPTAHPPAPASKKAVRRLCTKIDIAQTHVDDGWECAIHKEPFGVGEVATRLPCGHVFLEDAILRWLDDHHSCPVCRHALPTDDEEAEAQRDADAAADAAAAAAAALCSISSNATPSS
ncbi:hypothetical protein CTAYLR_002461 [Chrysophaeum taylorii]|uniref:cGMP-dependent protein kinase n=1 Tax=Chrysophaeum taylorii TaxID=2483200 RepID=A0AAD7XQX7_9STRA|nr:hypothetical protein CTAYLR_002461 [Chrysophaeum taylorii]